MTARQTVMAVAVSARSHFDEWRASLLVRGSGVGAHPGGAPRPPAVSGSDDAQLQAANLRMLRSLLSSAITVDARKRAPKGPGSSALVTGTTVASGSNGAAQLPTCGGDATTPAPTPGGGGGRASLLPFAPEELERRLEKVGGRQAAARQDIDNSMEGLRAYLSALNIRNKCKHPLFLILRFDACVGLLYDPSRESNPAEDDAAFSLPERDETTARETRTTRACA